MWANPIEPSPSGPWSVMLAVMGVLVFTGEPFRLNRAQRALTDLGLDFWSTI